MQIVEGTPTEGSGPLRIGVTDIEGARQRVIDEMGVPSFDIYSREEVPVKWGTFLGFYEYLDKKEEEEKLNERLYR